MDEGVTASRCHAYRGFSSLTSNYLSRHEGSRERGGLICHAAENGIVIMR